MNAIIAAGLSEVSLTIQKWSSSLWPVDALLESVKPYKGLILQRQDYLQEI